VKAKVLVCLKIEATPTQNPGGIHISAALEAPVVIIFFNRPEATRVVFRAVAEVKPRKLLLVADGPRSFRPGEAALCSEARRIATRVDWPCEVLTNFSETNLGCQQRVISGLDWVFSKVESAIILEDDCLPQQSFFFFCQEMLTRYRGDTRIGMISGINFVAPRMMMEYSYYFSRIFHTWGWATWRSAWQHYDRYLREWPTIKRNEVLREVYPRDRDFEYWTNIFDRMHGGIHGPATTTWDYQWFYTNLISNRLSIVPKVNMVTNIGFGKDATHTADPAGDGANLPSYSLEFPLKHPPHLIPMRSFDDLNQRMVFVPSIAQIARRRLRKLLRRLWN
jgi:hypothetical protein